MTRRLHAKGFRPPGGIRRLYGYTTLMVEAALAEDVGAGDITTDPIVPPGVKGSCEVIAKEDMVVAGLFVAEAVFKSLDPKASLRAGARDGDLVKKGVVIATVRGSMRALLTGERVALNFLQRLSGVATLARKFSEKASRSGIEVLDTRKTTPCMRMLEKYAVFAGGGVNHRYGLFDRVLIKDNHIAAAGGIREAVSRVRSSSPGVPVEVETRTLKEVREALEAGAEVIMLDNMPSGRMKKAVGLIAGRARVEASGGVTIDKIAKIAAAGVDCVSVGGLTHSAPAVDISMKMNKGHGKRKPRG